MATKRRASGPRGKRATPDLRATQSRFDANHLAHTLVEQADLIELDRLKAEVYGLATGESLQSLKAAITDTISKWLVEHRVAAARPRTAITQLDQRRIRDVLTALSIPEPHWVSRIKELEDAITAGQSLDDLSHVNLDDVMAAAVDTLMKRYLTARDQLTAAQLK